MKNEKLTEKMIGCAYKVYNKMGSGFSEPVYEKCLLLELKKTGLKAEAQHPIVVYYEDAIVGEFSADIIVEDSIILEIKAVKRLLKHMKFNWSTI